MPKAFLPYAWSAEIAIALTPILVTAGIDLSAGSIMGPAAVVFGAALQGAIILATVGLTAARKPQHA